MHKKILSVMILTIMLLVGCISNDLDSSYMPQYHGRIALGETLHDIKQRYSFPHSSWGIIHVYEVEFDEFQLVIFGLDARVEKIADFFPGSGVWNEQGFSPVHIDDPLLYIGMTEMELAEELGDIHVSAGLTLYLPGYITDDGYLICFYLVNGRVKSIAYRDLISNQEIKTYSIDDSQEDDI